MTQQHKPNVDRGPRPQTTLERAQERLTDLLARWNVEGVRS
jgi:hypothetical protein